MPPLRPSYASSTSQPQSSHGWPSYTHAASPPKHEYYNTNRDHHHLYHQHQPPAPHHHTHRHSYHPPPHHTETDHRNVRQRLSVPGPFHPAAASPRAMDMTSAHTNAGPSSPSPSPEGEERSSSPTLGNNSNNDRRGDAAQRAKTIQSKACVNCRRSKVKCVNDGSGDPCRRCLDIKLECKWRVRIDDEAWRESVESRFNNLTSKVDAILSPPASSRKPDSAVSPCAGSEVYQHPAYGSLYPMPKQPGSMLPPPTIPGPRSSATAYSPVGHTSLPPPIFQNSPSSDPSSSVSASLNAPSPRDRLPPPAMLMGNADTPVSNGDYNHWTHRRGGSSSSIRLEGLLAAGSSSQQPFFPNPDYKPSPRGDPLRSNQTSTRVPSTSALPSARLPLLSYQGRAPYILQKAIGQADSIKLSGRSVQWDVGTYASAVSYVGQEDPRLSLISLRILPCALVTNLFLYFGKNLQSHSFGFPTFAPNEKMTPLILACVCLVSCLFDPSARQYMPAVRQYIAGEARLVEADSLSEYQKLDPERGVGVEEITAVCLAAAWLSGDDGNRLAKIARHWALAYLRQFEARTSQAGSAADREKTIAEKLTLLPPYRIVNQSLRLRIWLESYIVDATASIMHDRDLFAPGQPSKLICEELRTSLQEKERQNGGGGGARTSPESTDISPEDAQLLGHASLLDILLLASNTVSKSDLTSDQAMMKLQELSEQDLEVWREQTDKDIDLTVNTPVSVDLGLSYYLARAYLGSLALSMGSPFSTSPSSLSPRGGAHATFSRVQHGLITQGKEAAQEGMQIAKDCLAERLLRLPTWYHYLLSHTVGFLLRLMQEGRWFITSQSLSLLTQVEAFVQLVHYHLAIHQSQAPSSAAIEAALASVPTHALGATLSSAGREGAEAAQVEETSHARGHTRVGSLSGVGVGADADAARAANGKVERATGSGSGGGGSDDNSSTTPSATTTTMMMMEVAKSQSQGHPAREMIEEMFRGVMKMRGQMST